MGNRASSVFLCLMAILGPACDTPKRGVADLLTAEERTYLEERGSIRLAPDPNFPPVEYFDISGQYAGLIADYFRIIEKRIGFEITIVRLESWDAVLREAEARHIDGITAAQITPERQQYLRYSQPIVDIPNVIIARHGWGPTTMASLDAAETHVALTRGNAIHEYVLRHYPGVWLELVRDDLSALQAVAFGQVDATVVNVAIASHLVRSHGLTGLEVVGDSGRSNPLAIATREDAPLLASILAKGLASVTVEEREELQKKWIHLDTGRGTLSREALIGLALAAGLLLLCGGLAVAWVVTLRRRVAERTRALEHEFEGRKRAEEERHAMEVRLLEAQRLESLGILAGGIAHDFNNLLMAIMGNADLALLDVGSGHIRDRLTDIVDGSKRASDLARQMLAYSGRGNVIVERVDLSAIVREMTRLLLASVPKSAKIVLDLPSEMPPVEADAAQLRQLVMNLITNAAEALPEAGGGIRLLVRQATHDEAWLNSDDNRAQTKEAPLPAGDYAVLEVRDEGCGMDEETVRRLFDPFFTTKFQGRGLGMSAVLGIVRSHRGALFVSSSPGAGTAFTVAFPLASGSSLQKEPPRPETERTSQPNRGLVLLIDDDPAVRVPTQALLEHLGFTVAAADRGEAGLAMFEQRRAEVHIVILDQTMPGMNGAEVYERLLALDPEVRVILASGYGEPLLSERYPLGDRLAFLGKPFDLAQLEAALGAVSKKSQPQSSPT